MTDAQLRKALAACADPYARELDAAWYSFLGYEVDTSRWKYLARIEGADGHRWYAMNRLTYDVDAALRFVPQLHPLNNGRQKVQIHCALTWWPGGTKKFTMECNAWDLQIDAHAAMLPTAILCCLMNCVSAGYLSPRGIRPENHLGI